MIEYWKTCDTIDAVTRRYKDRTIGILKGSSKLPPIKWEEWEIKQFNLFHFSQGIQAALLKHKLSDCGSSLIMKLTSMSVRKLHSMRHRHREFRGSTSETLMVKVLKTHGYKMRPITDWDLNDNQEMLPRLGYDHAVLACVTSFQRELTWVLYWGGVCNHGHEKKPMDLYETFHRRPVSLYLINHERWMFKLPPSFSNTESGKEMVQYFTRRTQDVLLEVAELQEMLANVQKITEMPGGLKNIE